MTRRKLLVLDVVGLTPSALEHAPRLRAIASEGFRGELRTVLPAVTCSAQASFLTGRAPSAHGIVGNGWYFRRLDEVLFWRQSRYLIDGDTIFDELKAAGRTTANVFGWFNWNCGADFSVTPKPSYPADGRKIPGIHTEPADLRSALEDELGPFPLFDFWGPRAGLRSSEWIADAASAVLEHRSPDLLFVYLPHLDYDHQRFGPDAPESIEAIGAIDRVAGDLCDDARERGYDLLVFSEYGLVPVRGFVSPNRVLRTAGYLRVRVDPHVGELPLFGTSRAFAVCDHQIAHVYVRDPADLQAVRELMAGIDGVAAVLDESGKREAGLDHGNAGDLVAIARPDRWFAYPWWLEDRSAPDYARTVDIHRKPGYDPAELFLDPDLSAPRLRILSTLARKKLGFRTLMRVISLDPSRVRGSHGRLPDEPSRGPVVLGSKGLRDALGSRDPETAGLSITDLRGLASRFLTTAPAATAPPGAREGRAAPRREDDGARRAAPGRETAE